jgi:hypothetical protein
MTTKLTYSEFKAKRINFNNSQPTYLKGIESNFEESTKLSYKMYIKGMVPKFAK